LGLKTMPAIRQNDWVHGQT